MDKLLLPRSCPGAFVPRLGLAVRRPPPRLPLTSSGNWAPHPPGSCPRAALTPPRPVMYCRRLPATGAEHPGRAPCHFQLGRPCCCGTPELDGSAGAGVWREGAAGHRQALDMLEPTRVGLGVCRRRGPAGKPCSVPAPSLSPALPPPTETNPPNLLLKLPFYKPSASGPCPSVPLPTGCCVDTQGPELPRLGSPRSRHGDLGATSIVCPDGDLGPRSKESLELLASWEERGSREPAGRQVSGTVTKSRHRRPLLLLLQKRL